jgi:hypothetical protein
MTHTNIMERIATFYKYKMNKNIGNNFPSVFLEMLKFG